MVQIFHYLCVVKGNFPAPRLKQTSQICAKGVTWVWLNRPNKF